MNLSDLLVEVKKRGEKLKKEILNEVVKSKTLNQIVSNENFVKAVSSIIATKDEVQKALRKQISVLVKTMEVVTHRDLSKMIAQLKNLEQVLTHLLYGKVVPPKTTTKKAAPKKSKAKRKKPSAKK